MAAEEPGYMAAEEPGYMSDIHQFISYISMQQDNSAFDWDKQMSFYFNRHVSYYESQMKISSSKV